MWRVGRLTDSVDRLDASLKLREDPPQTRAEDWSPVFYDWLFLAMADYRLGHTNEAKEWLERAPNWTPAAFVAPANAVQPPLSWPRHLTLDLLRREAKALITSNLQTQQ